MNGWISAILLMLVLALGLVLVPIARQANGEMQACRNFGAHPIKLASGGWVCGRMTIITNDSLRRD